MSFTICTISQTFPKTIKSFIKKKTQINDKTFLLKPKIDFNANFSNVDQKYLQFHCGLSDLANSSALLWAASTAAVTPDCTSALSRTWMP